MFLYLIRHGETEWNSLGKTQGQKDISLNNSGVWQAERLGKRLKEQKAIDKIYCSDLSRAKETAEIIGRDLKLDPIPHETLREVSFGKWEGLSIKEIEILFPGELWKWRHELSFAPEGGESLLSAQERIGFFIKDMKRKFSDKDVKILIVSHALTTKILALSLMGIGLNLITQFKISQGSLSLVEIHEGNSSIIYLNDTCHLKV
ncbi:MAG: histidine phosphatase family protein [Clostridiales bacterium]|nr:histidine phosphatase family protein [Clostridiales bacterium]